MVHELLSSRPSDPYSFMMGYIQAPTWSSQTLNGLDAGASLGFRCGFRCGLVSIFRSSSGTDIHECTKGAVGRNTSQQLMWIQASQANRPTPLPSPFLPVGSLVVEAVGIWLGCALLKLPFGRREAQMRTRTTPPTRYELRDRTPTPQRFLHRICQTGQPYLAAEMRRQPPLQRFCSDRRRTADLPLVGASTLASHQTVHSRFQICRVLVFWTATWKRCSKPGWPRSRHHSILAQVLKEQPLLYEQLKAQGCVCA